LIAILGVSPPDGGGSFEGGIVCSRDSFGRFCSECWRQQSVPEYSSLIAIFG
jgi:hypothetical protein